MSQLKFEMKDYKDSIDNKAFKFEIKDIYETLKGYTKVFFFEKLEATVKEKVDITDF